MSKNIKKWLALVLLVTLLLTLVFAGQGLAKDKLKTAEQLGEFLYFDEDLSEPAGQACASCHLPEVGFDDPDSDVPVSEGIISGLFGGRNSPASAYAMYAPAFHFDEAEGLWIGGQFWDGRATGDVLGDPLADQALGPFLNPVEMANPDKAVVVKDVTRSSYSNLFKEVCGKVKFYDLTSVEAAYDCIAESIAAFERTELFGQFTSKYDVYLQDCIVEEGGLPDDCAKGIGLEAELAGAAILTPDEWSGLQLFMDEGDGGAKCVLCHVADWTIVTDYELPVVMPQWTVGTAAEGMIPPVFTDFTFDNLGVPINPTVYELAGGEPPDLGLGPIVDDADENGKFKVMTLRNIGLTAPYAHNGFFADLEDITHFYNTRDVEAWPEPEYADTVNFDELGDLGLSPEDEAALVEFMMTLSDGWTP